MKVQSFFKIILLGCYMVCSGCNGDVMTKNEIEEAIAKDLSPGSDNQKIIKLFERYNWIYDFNRHIGRYQARNPEEDKLPEVIGRNQIYIYVNEEKEFVRAEVEKVFKGL